MIEKNFIGHTLSAKGERVTRGSNPVTSEVLPGDFINATDEEITDTCLLYTSPSPRDS